MNYFWCSKIDMAFFVFEEINLSFVGSYFGCFNMYVSILPWPAWALGPAQQSMLGSILAPPAMASEFPPSSGEIFWGALGYQLELNSCYCWHHPTWWPHFQERLLSVALAEEWRLEFALCLSPWWATCHPGFLLVSRMLLGLAPSPWCCEVAFTFSLCRPWFSCWATK